MNNLFDTTSKSTNDLDTSIISAAKDIGFVETIPNERLAFINNKSETMSLFINPGKDSVSFTNHSQQIKNEPHKKEAFLILLKERD